MVVSSFNFGLLSDGIGTGKRKAPSPAIFREGAHWSTQHQERYRHYRRQGGGPFFDFLMHRLIAGMDRFLLNKKATR